MSVRKRAAEEQLTSKRGGEQEADLEKMWAREGSPETKREENDEEGTEKKREVSRESEEPEGR